MEYFLVAVLFLAIGFITGRKTSRYRLPKPLKMLGLRFRVMRGDAEVWAGDSAKEMKQVVGAERAAGHAGELYDRGTKRDWWPR